VISGRYVELAAVFALYQIGTSLLDIVAKPLARIPVPLKLQAGDIKLEKLTIDTSVFADSAASAAFQKCISLHGAGLVDNLVIFQCNFIGTVDMDSAKFKDYSYIDGRGGYQTGSILFESCCFMNSGGHSAIQIRGPTKEQGQLVSVGIKGCHFEQTAGCVCVRAMPLNQHQNAIESVVIEGCTYKHAPHTKSDPACWGIIEVDGAVKLLVKDLTVENAEGDLFATSNADSCYNVVQAWTKAHEEADSNKPFLDCDWVFDNIKITNSSFSSIVNIPTPTPEFHCPIIGQAAPGLQFVNFAADAAVGATALVSHLFPANANGVYRAKNVLGHENDLPPNYNLDYDYILDNKFGAERIQMFEGANYA
jgi:hypothetical protein